jgi:hypothetical protein
MANASGSPTARPQERPPETGPVCERGADSAPRIDLGKLPAGAPEFLGRGPELRMLDAA